MSSRREKVLDAEVEHLIASLNPATKGSNSPKIPYAKATLKAYGVDALVSDMLHQLEDVTASLTCSPRRRPNAPASPYNESDKDDREFIRRSAEILKEARGEGPLVDPELTRMLSGFDTRTEPRSSARRSLQKPGAKEKPGEPDRPGRSGKPAAADAARPIDQQDTEPAPTHPDLHAASAEQAGTWSGTTLQRFEQILKQQESQAKQLEATLAAFTQQFMVQMNESAGASVTRIGGVLDDLMRQLSTHMGELEQKMAASMHQSAEKSAAGAANAIKEQAGTWSDRSTQQMDQLLKQQESHTAQMKEAETALADFMQQFTDRMNESAGTSVSRIGSALTDIMRDLSTHVSELEQRMAASMQENAEKSAGAAAAVLEQAGTCTARSAERFDELLKQQESHAERAKNAEAALADFMQQFMARMNESAMASVTRIGSALTGVIGELSAHVSELERKMAASMQENAERAAGAAIAAVEQAGGWTTQSAEQLDRLLKQQESQAKQVEASLVAFMQQFMAQMNESAGESVIEIGNALSDVMRELSTQVNELERKMAASMQENAERAAGAATAAAAEQAAAWTARSAEQIDQLLKQKESQAKQVETTLVAFMQQFMIRMNESAGASVTRIEGALTDVMLELSTHVSELERKMAASIQQNAEKSAGAANAVEQAAETWSVRNTQQLDQLLRQQESQARQIKDVESTLVSFMQQFVAQVNESAGDSVARIGDALTGVMQELSAHVSELEQKMAVSVQQNAGSASAAAVSVDQAEKWSAPGPQQIDQLLKQQESQAKQLEAALVASMQQFMSQMNESAGASVVRIGDDLTGVMRELSTRVNELEQKIAVSIQQNSEKSADAAAMAVEQAETWRSGSAQQFGQILKQQEDQAKQMESTLVSFMQQSMAQISESAGASVTRIGDALTGMMRELSTHVSELEQKLAASLQEKQENAEKAAAVEQAEIWTARSAQQLDLLLAQQESQAKQLEAALVTSLQQSMVRTNRSAGESLIRIGGDLTGLIHELTTHVSELEQKVTTSMRENAEKAATAAAAVEQAETWSNRRVQQLEQLLTQRESQAKQLEAALVSSTRQSMAWINDCAEAPATRIGGDLTGVVRDLPAHVSRLEQEMSASMLRDTEREAVAAHAVEAPDGATGDTMPEASIEDTSVADTFVSAGQEHIFADLAISAGVSDTEYVQGALGEAGDPVEEVCPSERETLLGEVGAEDGVAQYESDLMQEPNPYPLTSGLSEELQFPHLNPRGTAVVPDETPAASAESVGFEYSTTPEFNPPAANYDIDPDKIKQSTAAESEMLIAEDGDSELPGEQEDEYQDEAIQSNLDDSEFEITASLRRTMATAPPKSKWQKFRTNLLSMSYKSGIRFTALILVILVTAMSVFYFLSRKVGAATTTRAPVTEESPFAALAGVFSLRHFGNSWIPPAWIAGAGANSGRKTAALAASQRGKAAVGIESKVVDGQSNVAKATEVKEVIFAGPRNE